MKGERLRVKGNRQKRKQMKITNKYGQTAIKAVEIHKTINCPKEAWKQAALEEMSSQSAQVKGCPKSAFLGLCETGFVKGIPKGDYTRSKKNKIYAIDAINILKRDGNLSLSAIELWEMINKNGISHNSQMDVVLALWKEKLIN